VVGGAHATVLPLEPLEFGADAVVTGNGDLVFPQVCADAFNGSLQKLYEGGQVPGNQLIPAKWDSLQLDKYLLPTVQTIVGCEKYCSYCTVHMIDGWPRQRRAEDVASEVDFLAERGFSAVVFADDNLAPAARVAIENEKNPQRRLRLEKARADCFTFFEAYKRASKHHLVGFTQLTLEALSDEEYLRAMRQDMNIRAVLVGVESITPEGKKSVRKGWNPTPSETVEIIRNAQEKWGIQVLSSFIIGLETDTPATIEATLQFALASGTRLTQYTSPTPLPGSMDYREMAQDYDLRHSAITSSAVFKHQTELISKRWWLDPPRRLVIKHPILSDSELLGGFGRCWKTFYNYKQVFARVRKIRDWPISIKVVLFLCSLGFPAWFVARTDEMEGTERQGSGGPLRLAIKVLRTYSLIRLRLRRWRRKRSESESALAA
jgi:radical SAM superfamily enzyme YgiQ (UPF0313 family)